MISIIDYKAGNLASVSNALNRLGVSYEVTFDQDRLDQSDAIIFPGVGHALAAMQALGERDLIQWLKNTTKPVLGICLGMQLLFESSEEGDSAGLGVLAGRLKKFDDTVVKVPHLGWNTFVDIKSHPLLDGISEESTMYYVHSYYAPVTDATLAKCEYQIPFASVVGKDNFYGVQFHPEKSGTNGEIILGNFLNIVRGKQ
mgnify:CR=1 FL=1